MQYLDCLVSRSPRASGASRGSIRTAWAASGRRPFPPSEGDKPRQVERFPAPGPPVFLLSLFARAFFVAGFEPGARRGARLPSNHCGPPEVFRFARRGMACVTRAERVRRISGCHQRREFVEKSPI
jgi:hypothetical protein